MCVTVPGRKDPRELSSTANGKFPMNKRVTACGFPVHGFLSAGFPVFTVSAPAAASVPSSVGTWGLLRSVFDVFRLDSTSISSSPPSAETFRFRFFTYSTFPSPPILTNSFCSNVFITALNCFLDALSLSLICNDSSTCFRSSLICMLPLDAFSIDLMDFFHAEASPSFVMLVVVVSRVDPRCQQVKYFRGLLSAAAQMLLSIPLC
mmetsp:Transcript_3855/g.10230  ORF Transcript_3855/g.10230 Transcript_3855/m.10230 type:complete len:206 (-) Transcript_3855:40-657(-)